MAIGYTIQFPVKIMLSSHTSTLHKFPIISYHFICEKGTPPSNIEFLLMSYFADNLIPKYCIIM